MVYLPEIIAHINTVLISKLTSYPTAQYHGIANPITVQRSSGQIVYPSTIELDGRANAVTFTFTAPFTIYHKLLNSNFTQRAGGKVFGQDAQRSMLSNTAAQIIIIGTRAEINVKPELLAMQIADSLPGVLSAPEYTTLGIQSVYVIETGIDYDQRALFNKEFQGIKYFIGPELFMLAVRYTIEGAYLKGCASLCQC